MSSDINIILVLLGIIIICFVVYYKASLAEKKEIKEKEEIKAKRSKLKEETLKKEAAEKTLKKEVELARKRNSEKGLKNTYFIFNYSILSGNDFKHNGNEPKEIIIKLTDKEKEFLFYDYNINSYSFYGITGDDAINLIEKYSDVKCVFVNRFVLYDKKKKLQYNIREINPINMKDKSKKIYVMVNEITYDHFGNIPLLKPEEMKLENVKRRTKYSVPTSKRKILKGKDLEYFYSMWDYRNKSEDNGYDIYTPKQFNLEDELSLPKENTFMGRLYIR